MMVACCLHRLVLAALLFPLLCLPFTTSVGTGASTVQMQMVDVNNATTKSYVDALLEHPLSLSLKVLF